MFETLKQQGNISYENIPGIKVYLLPAESINLRQVMMTQNILGIVRFGEDEGYPELEGLKVCFPAMNVVMKTFSAKAYYEVWTSENTVACGNLQGLQFSSDGFHQLLTVCIKEEDRDIREIGRLAYDLIFQSVEENNYPNISRVWNHIPNINQFGDGTERYIRFCLGRAEAFAKNGNIFPAATGIGCQGNSLCIYMISMRKDMNIYLENPNQTPAYKYPEKYGIKPPSFARGAYTDCGGGRGRLYVSGTASIIGSETVHVGEAARQCETTLNNISVLISGTNLSSYGINKAFTLKNLDCIKVYIKDEADYEIINTICSSSFSPDKSIAYLKADVCRNDLLVEIEGIVMEDP